MHLLIWLRNLKQDSALKVLHDIQIDYLIKWREREENDPKLSDQYLLELLLLVNALSGGLKGTG